MLQTITLSRQNVRQVTLLLFYFPSGTPPMDLRNLQLDVCDETFKYLADLVLLTKYVIISKSQVSVAIAQELLEFSGC